MVNKVGQNRNMSQYSIYAAKTNFSKLVQKALRGEKVIIANRDKPILQLVPIEKPEPKHLIGLLKGKVKITDDFDEPLEDFEDYT